MIDPREQQLQYEIESDAEAAAARLNKLREQAAAGDTSLPKTSRFIARAYAAVKDSLVAEAAQVRRGRGAKLATWIRAVDPSIAAVIAIRECITALTGGRNRERPVTIQVLAGAIGRLYELEIRIKEAETVNPVYMRKINEQVKERGTSSKHHLAGVYSHAYQQVMKEHADSKLSAPETIHLGKFGVQACIDAGLVVLHKTREKGGMSKLFFYELADEVEDYLTEYSNTDVQSVRDVGAGLMFCEPDPWHTLLGGGYLSPRRKQAAPLMSLHGIRKLERRRLRDEFTAENMPVVFECANYLQSIPLDMHMPTLGAIRELWHAGGGALGVPQRLLPPKPTLALPPTWAKAEGTEEERELFYQWKRAATKWYDVAREWRSKVRELGGFLRAAGKVEGPMWLPVFMDTRGRWYYRGTPNPQGSDIAKAVIHFHDKKPLGKRGVYWLKVAVANNFGFDKARFDLRAKWTEENWERIQQALPAPADAEDTLGKDAPWCMFSAAWELQRAYMSGDPESYCSGVPVHMDATCSGLQHFSAILFDPVGGLYVNLYDDNPDFMGPKQDIYGKVGNETLKEVREDLNSDDPDIRRYAEVWLEFGISRDLAKTPVMTYVYGATLRGTSEFVQDKMEDVLGADCWPADVSGFKCSMYMARKLFQGIANTVPASAEAMRWLRGVARGVPNGQRMEWTTPTGFKVQHDYQGFDEIRVRIASCGITQALVREFNDSTLPMPMQNAISPNFVHALDASHLTLTALGMKKRGLQMLAIHDSFATHPCDVDALHEIVRDEFAKMYASGDILEKFLWEVNAVGEVPQRGDLDINRVRSSEFFFC
jgi:DNA-directed RNA polymerase